MKPRSVTISLHRPFFLAQKREVVEVSLGCHVHGARLPYPSTHDPMTALGGVTKRISAKLPIPEPMALPNGNVISLPELGKFCRGWLEKHCKPLAAGDIMEPRDWIDSRPYPEWRKDQLRKVADDLGASRLIKKHKKVKSFIKQESYTPKPKHARGIFSRTDYFKVKFGPICSKIEEQIYEIENFIKHIPVKDRPKYMEDYFSNCYGENSATDYTSFESSFTPEVMSFTDKVMFDYFLQYINNDEFEDIVSTLRGTNECVFKWFTLYLEGARMSGEMNTSLSNGFANLMVMSFLVNQLGYGELKMVVEGDDALAQTSTGKFPTSEHFSKLGFNIKLELHKDRASASFCGIIYNQDDLINVTDPKEVMASFGWANSRYCRSKTNVLKALLRAKSFSYAFQYPGCPIIQEMAAYGLRMTKGMDIRHFVKTNHSMSLWEREQVLAALDCGYANLPFQQIPMGTRQLVEEQFGITVEEQIHIEDVFRRKQDLSPFAINIDWPIEYYISFNKHVCLKDLEDSVCFTNGVRDKFYEHVMTTEVKFLFSDKQ